MYIYVCNETWYRSRTGTLVAAYACLALGFTGLTWASIEAANLQAILLLVCAIFCGYIYQVGKLDHANTKKMVLLDSVNWLSEGYFCSCSFQLLVQCPPFRLSYHGLGEPLCFAAFGPFATTAFYMLMEKNRYLEFGTPYFKKKNNRRKLNRRD